MKKLMKWSFALLILGMFAIACNTESSKDTKEQAEETMEEAKKDMKETAESAEKTMDQKKKHVKDIWSNSADQIDQYIGQLEDKMGDASENAKQDYRVLIADLKDLKKQLQESGEQASEKATDKMADFKEEINQTFIKVEKALNSNKEEKK